jgi:hypothetical protein
MKVTTGQEVDFLINTTCSTIIIVHFGAPLSQSWTDAFFFLELSLSISRNCSVDLSNHPRNGEMIRSYREILDNDNDNDNDKIV